MSQTIYTTAEEKPMPGRRTREMCEARPQHAVSAVRVHQLLLLLAAVVAVGMAAPCSAASTRGEVLLEGPSITVGDLFSDAGERAKDVVAPAPEPGRKTVYDVNTLLQVARLAGLDWKPASNYERVTLTRAGEKISASDILEAVKNEMARTAPGKEFDLALDQRTLDINRPKGEKPAYHLADFNFDVMRNRFEASLLVDATPSHDVEVIKVAGRAMPMVQVAILASSLPAGSSVGASDVEWRAVPQDKAGADAFTDAGRLASVETRRNLSAGSVLRLRDVRGARLVTKGTMVSIVVETPSMQLIAQGRALNDAEMGETVRVINTQSNRTIDAVVIGSNKVSGAMASGAALIAAQ